MMEQEIRKVWCTSIETHIKNNWRTFIVLSNRSQLNASSNADNYITGVMIVILITSGSGSNSDVCHHLVVSVVGSDSSRFDWTYDGCQLGGVFFELLGNLQRHPGLEVVVRDLH